jgi:hypothetical protein
MIPTQIDIDGHDQPERVCACGCKRSLDGMRRDAVWYSRAHAVRWARSNPGKSLLDAHNANGGRTRRRSGRSGVQVSYRKAVEAIVKGFTPHTYGHWCYPQSFEDDVRQSAEVALRSALSDRQRAQLEQKGKYVGRARNPGFPHSRAKHEADAS